MTKRLPLVLNGGRVGELPPTDTLDIEMALSGTFVAGGYDPLRSAPSVSFNPALTEVTFSTTQAIAEVAPKHAGGIRYIEVTFVGGASSGNAAVGVVGPAADLAHQIGYDGAADEVGMFQNTGRIYSGNTLTVTNGPFFDDGDVVGMAVNATTRRVWFRINGGVWNGSGGNSPITGVGGVLIAGSGDIYAAVCSDDTATYRVNVGAVLAGAVPWGQTSPPGVITPQDVAITDPVQGQMLRYDNGAWTNFNLTTSLVPEGTNQYWKEAPTDGKAYIRKNGTWAEQTASNTYTVTAISGTVAAEAVDVNVVPSANSTAVVFARRDQVNFNTNRNILSGGWLTAHQSVVNLGASAGTVDKVVADFAQVNIDGTAQVNTVLMYEVSVARVNAAANITGVVGFYFPNLRAVANIGRIGTLAAFASDDPVAICRIAGPFFNRTLQEFAPPYHPGLVPGRYYSAPYRLIGDAATTAGFAACIPVHIPHTCKISEMGFIVSTAIASSQAVMALYTSEKGKVQNRIWQSATAISTASTGTKTQAPNVEVSPGTYWLLLLTSANLTVKFHQPQGSDGRMVMMGQPAADTQDNNLNRVAYLPMGGFAVGAFPAQIASVPSFLNQDNEPHVWFRVS